MLQYIIKAYFSVCLLDLALPVRPLSCQVNQGGKGSHLEKEHGGVQTGIRGVAEGGAY